MNRRRALECLFFFCAAGFLAYFLYEGALALGEETKNRPTAAQTAQAAQNRFETLRQQAQDANDAEAQFHLANAYYHGQGVAGPDPALALEWYGKAADQGHIGAQVMLGSLYDEGAGVPRDLQKSIAYYNAASEAGDANATERLAWIYFENEELENNYLKAAALFQSIAAHSHDAQYMLGYLYYEGKGFPQNYAQARHWFEAARAAGNTRPPADLAYIYERGLETPPDLIKAGALYAVAIKSNASGAEKHIAAKNRRCQDVFQYKLPPATITDCFLAAESGYAAAQYMSALLLINKAALGPQGRTAEDYLLMAAKQDYLVAQIDLANGYNKGAHGLPLAPEKAYGWLSVLATRPISAEMEKPYIEQAKNDLAALQGRIDAQSKTKGDILAIEYRQQIIQR